MARCSPKGERSRPSGVWALLGIEWSAGVDAAKVAAIFASSRHEWKPCLSPGPGITIMAYRSAVGCASDAAKATAFAPCRAAIILAEMGDRGSGILDGPFERLEALIRVAPDGHVICSAAVADAGRGAGNKVDVNFIDLGFATLPEIGGRELVFLVADASRPMPRVRLDTTERPVDTLPADLGYFQGRKEELGRASALLERHPIVTITGLVGIGKSHFANRLAREAKGDFKTGVAWARLDTANDYEEALKRIVGALELPAKVRLAEVVERFVGDHEILLVLDGVKPDDAELAGLLGRCLRRSRSKFLITSSQSLGLPDEAVLAVGPLDVPPEGAVEWLEDLYEYDATALFVDRVSQRNERFAEKLEPETVAEIVRRLGGHPHAICLAALRSLTTDLGEILDSLPRFSPTTVLRTSVLQILSGLPEDAREAAEILAFCETPASRAQVASMSAGTDIEAKSLTRVVEAGLAEEALSETGRVVYRLYPSVRSLLEPTLAGKDVRRRVHDDFFIEALKVAVSGEGMHNAVVEEHTADIEVAVDRFARKRPASDIYELFRELWPYFYDHNHIDEGLLALKLALLRWNVGLMPAQLHNMAANLATKGGRSQTAREMYSRALLALEREPAPVLRAMILANLGMLSWSEGHPTRARTELADGIELLRQAGDAPRLAQALWSSVISHIECGDPASARAALEESILLAPPLTTAERWCIQLARGQIEWSEKRYGTAKDTVLDAIELAREMEDGLSVLRSLIWLSQVLADSDAQSRSTQVLGVIAYGREENAAALYPTNRLRLDRLQSLLEIDLGEQAYREEFVTGAALGLDQVLGSVY